MPLTKYGSYTRNNSFGLNKSEVNTRLGGSTKNWYKSANLLWKSKKKTNKDLKSLKKQNNHLLNMTKKKLVTLKISIASVR